jgi:enediyne biosynthesis protein E4
MKTNVAQASEPAVSQNSCSAARPLLSLPRRLACHGDWWFMDRNRSNRDPKPRSAISVLIISTLSSLIAFSAFSAPIQLHNVTSQTGITFVHTDGSSGNRYIVETIASGLALFDYDNDGDIDIYFLNGAPLGRDAAPPASAVVGRDGAPSPSAVVGRDGAPSPSAVIGRDPAMAVEALAKSAPAGPASSPRPRNSLWRNDGHWKFTDVTTSSGLGDETFSLGVATADYDNDGDQDVYVSNFGSNKLYRNNGDGTFSDATKTAGLPIAGRDAALAVEALAKSAPSASVVGRDGAPPPSAVVSPSASALGAGVAFFDLDNDGDLDLFAARYVNFTYASHRSVRFNGHPAYAGPLDFQPSPVTLFRNNGKSAGYTFTDITAEAGLAKYKGAGMGVVCADFDNDRDTDLFVANDKTGNFLFLNDGQGTFRENAGLAGVAYDLAGRAQGSMGVECADFDNDGLLDLYVTTYQQELATLFKNQGARGRSPLFEDVTPLTRAGEGTLRYVKWGVGMVDFDNDGWRDIFIACGHLHDNVHLFDNTTSYECPAILLRNTGGKFQNITDQAGDVAAVRRSARGAAFDDLDNDGDIDVVILNSRREPTILRNDSPPAHWLAVQLIGATSNRDGIGARVTVTAGDLSLIDEVRSGRGYQSDYGRRLHFGLGQRDKIDRIEIHWPSGQTDLLRHPAIDQLLVVREGMSPP